MSYCRFSCDDFSSDVYCYESCFGGFAIHVAANKVIGDIPKVSHLFAPANIEEYMEAHSKQIEWLQTAERQPIGLPHDGNTFNEGTAADAAARLIELKEIGYRVPQRAIDALQEEGELREQ